MHFASLLVGYYVTDLELDMLLVKKLVEIIAKMKHIKDIKFLQKVYDHVKDWKIYKTALDIAGSEGQEKAVIYLWTNREKVIKFLEEKKDIITPLTSASVSMATKRVASRVGTKTVIRYGAKATSRGVKSLKAVGNPATLVVDVAQGGLEITGHQNAGMAVGFLGNFGTGAITGFMVGGPIGATIGAGVCVASWFTGEVVGSAAKAAVEKTYSYYKE